MLFVVVGSRSESELTWLAWTLACTAGRSITRRGAGPCPHWAPVPPPWSHWSRSPSLRNRDLRCPSTGLTPGARRSEHDGGVVGEDRRDAPCGRRSPAAPRVPPPSEQRQAVHRPSLGQARTGCRRSATRPPDRRRQIAAQSMMTTFGMDVRRKLADDRRSDRRSIRASSSTMVYTSERSGRQRTAIECVRVRPGETLRRHRRSGCPA